MSKSNVIYIAECGDSYTRDDIEVEIIEYMTSRPEFIDLSDEKFNKTIDIIYNMVMSVMAWEHPCTICDQFNDDDFEVIFEKLKSE